MFLPHPTALPGLVLRPWQPSDAASLAEHANDVAIASNLGDVFPHPYQLADATYFIQDVAMQNPTHVMAVVWQDHAIGGCALTPGTDIHRHSAKVGYWLGVNYWGRGFASAAIAALSAHALVQMGYRRLWAGVFAHNMASARVLHKCGYRLEGTQRQAVLKDGQLIDQLLFARLDTY